MAQLLERHSVNAMVPLMALVVAVKALLVLHTSR